MPPIGIYVLAHVFSALLPPINPEDRDYYDVLNVPRSATNAEIRKAYKKKSLELHPDKVAQRRASEDAMAEAAKEYEQVQEAYGVLVKDDKRQQYHALAYSPTRYRFVARGGLSSPGALYENLVAASCVDKTRLMLLTSIIFMILLIQPILIATKINHVAEQRGNLQDADWVHILIPFWIIYGLVVVFWCLLTLIVPGQAKITIILTAVEQILWYVGIFSLAVTWDGKWDSPYRKVLIPIYLAMTLRWIQAALIIYKVLQDVDRMITREFLESEVLKGKTLEELSEEERKQVMEDFLLVTVPPDFEVEENQGDEQELTPKQIEQQKVEASPEYETAIEIYRDTLNNLIPSVIFGIVFVILLVLKLDEKIQSNWWTVFTPVWIYYGSKLLYNMYGCLCMSFSGEDIILHMHSVQETKDNEANKQEEETEKEETRDVEEQKKNDDDNKDTKPEEQKYPPKTDAPAVYDDGIRVTPDEEEKESNDNDTTVAKPEVKDGSNDKSDEFTTVELSDTITDNKKPDEESPSDKDKKDEKENGDKDKKDDDDDDDDIPFDEETFRAFQSAYAEAEQGAMEAQAKASTNCCTACFQLLMLCLVVAKLDATYEQDDPTLVGFNTFWILSPFLLFFGLIFCLCACLIYGAGPVEEEVDENENGEGPAGGDEEAPPIQLAAPPAETTTIPLPPPTVPTTEESPDTKTDAEEKESSMIADTSGTSPAAGSRQDPSPSDEADGPSVNIQKNATNDEIETSVDNGFEDLD